MGFLFGLGVAAAGIYGLSMAWTEMNVALAKQRLHSIEIEEGHLDVIEHFELILGMLSVKPYDGVLPEDGYKECQDLLMLELMYVTDDDLKKFEEHYNKVRKAQIKEREEKGIEEIEEEIDNLLIKCNSDGYEKRKESPGRLDYTRGFEIIETTVTRCDRLYNETPWKRVVKGPAKVIKTSDGKSKEMWMLKYDYYGIKSIYKKCNEVLGYSVSS